MTPPRFGACVLACAALVLAPLGPCAAARNDGTPAALTRLRNALATDDLAAGRRLLVPDAVLVELRADVPPRYVQGRDAVLATLRTQTASVGDTGPALRMREGFTVGPLVVIAESLPRIAKEPTRLAIYRLSPSQQIERIWVFPAVAPGEPSQLPLVYDYRAAWASGRWPEVARFHAPDVEFLEIEGTAVHSAGSLDQRRRCYEDGFRMWRTRRVPGAHPNTGCSGGPVEIVSAIAVGPYVATVEKRWWATPEETYEGRMFLYVADATGVRRVYYVLTL